MLITGKRAAGAPGKRLISQTGCGRRRAGSIWRRLQNVQCQHRLLREDDADLQPLFYGAYLSGVLQNGAFAIGGSLGHFASWDILANYSFIDGKMFACGRGTNTRLDQTVREVHLSAKESDFISAAECGFTRNRAVRRCCRSLTMRRRGQAVPCTRLRGWRRPPIGEFTIPKRSACCFSGGFRRDVLFVRPGGSDKPGAVVERQYRRFCRYGDGSAAGGGHLLQPVRRNQHGHRRRRAVADVYGRRKRRGGAAGYAGESGNTVGKRMVALQPEQQNAQHRHGGRHLPVCGRPRRQAVYADKTAAELAENNPDYGIYKPVFADDLSLLSVVSHTNPSSAAGGYRGDAYGYVLANGDGRLYAQRTVDLAGESFVTGFATGNTAGGRVEFNGALPELSLKVNVTPAPDTFEFTGEAE